MAVTNKRLWLLFVLIFFLALSVRLPGLGKFMTADEGSWMIRSGEFWHNLFLNNDPGGTFRTTHPGVITMWLAGGGIFVQELRLGFHIDQSNLEHFRIAATLPIAFATALLVAGVGLQFALLVPSKKYHWLGGALLAVDPYLIGMSQIVHVDALLALLMLNCLLATILFGRAKQATQRRVFLIIAGICAGAAGLNKFFPALWLLPTLPVILLFQANGSWRWRARSAVIQLVFLLGVSFLTAVLLWPALSVAGDLTRSFVRDASTVATTAHVDISQLEDAKQAKYFYGLTFLTRVPPFVMAVGGAVAVVVLFTVYKKRQAHPLLYLLGFSITYFLFISLVAKKADRYALPALIIWPLLAGFGVMLAMFTIKRTAFYERHSRAVTFVFLLVCAATILQTIAVMPYTIAYNNPLFDVRPLSQQGWGEGLEAVAGFLNREPRGKKLAVASWYPTVFGTYYHGDTYSLSSRDDKRVGMVVLYRNMLGRGPDEEGTNIWDEFKNKKPAFTSAILGKPYVWVYEIVRLHYFPRITGELIGETVVGQVIPVEKDNWDRIDLGLATYSGRLNTHDVVVHVRSDINSSLDLRTITRSATDIIDSDWNEFSFDPIPNSVGKSFFVFLTSSDSKPGNAISVRYSEQDIRPGQMWWRRRTDLNPNNQDAFLKTGDLAYQIP